MSQYRPSEDQLLADVIFFDEIAPAMFEKLVVHIILNSPGRVDFDPRATMKRLEELALSCAVDAAPYFHPKLIPAASQPDPPPPAPPGADIEHRRLISEAIAQAKGTLQRRSER